MQSVFPAVIAFVMAVALYAPARAATTACPVQAPAGLTSPGELTLGTAAAAVPAGMQPSPVDGFNTDFGMAMAETMCLKPAFVHLAFAGLFPGLNARKFDAVMYVGITAQRAESFAFVPYFLGGIRMIARKGTGLYFKDEQAVCGHSVAAVAGSVEVHDLDKYKADCPAGHAMDIHIFSADQEGLEQLRKGTVEAVFLDWGPAVYAVQQNPEFTIASPILTGEPPGQPRHVDGIMVRKDDAAMAAAISQAVAALRSNGTYERLLAKWGVQDGDVTKGG